jgi:hypothetical protein
VESYLSNEFEAKLKKIVAKSRANIGKIIHRQTGTTTYELVKNSKAGGKLWSSTAASMFDINLKSVPYESNEDF